MQQQTSAAQPTRSQPFLQHLPPQTVAFQKPGYVFQPTGNPAPYALHSNLFTPPFTHNGFGLPNFMPSHDGRGGSMGSFSSGSTSTNAPSMSPLSLAACEPQSPLTPLSLSSPDGPRNSISSQGGCFGAMQDAFMANQAQPLQHLQRMSISASVPSNGDKGLRQHRSVDSLQRRASVVTFQPTSGRPHITPQRPPIQTQANSAPILHVRTAVRSPLAADMQSERTPTMQQMSSFSPCAQPVLSPPIHNGQGAEVGNLYTDVFGNVRSTVALPNNPAVWAPPNLPNASSASMPSASNSSLNFSGVLLQPDDLHMLNVTSLSGSTDPFATNPLPPASLVGQAGWQPSFSFGQPAQQDVSMSLTLQHPTYLTPGAASQWNFSSFHGFAPIVTPGIEHSTPMLERAISAPPRKDEMQLPNAYIPIMSMNRRRGSSIDRPSLQPSGSQSTAGQILPVPVQTVYPGHAHLGVPQRRASSSTSSFATPTRGYGPYPGSTAPPTRSRSKSPRTISPQPAPARKAGGKPSARRSSTAPGTPMFINFTSKDANKLLSGVAPSGSSKRKREEEEQSKNSKVSRDADVVMT